MLLLMIAAPLIGALITGLLPYRLRTAVIVSALVAGTSLIAGILCYVRLLDGDLPALLLSGAGLPGGMLFAPDAAGLLLAIVTAVVWLAAALAAGDYMRRDSARGYFTSYLLTLSGVIGTFIAGDWLTLLLWFEVMTLSSYLLVIHTRAKDAMSAGDLYLYLSLGGSMVLVTGIAMLGTTTGSLSLAARLPDSSLGLLAAVLMIAGFGVKAGMIPLHLWLPQAHPVAPAPASAVLSGIMIKTGAYGILRTLIAASSGPGHELGLGLMIFAAVTMVGGVSMALLQGNAKRMLAYHSISQMGYILVGLGAASFLGATDVMGITGSLYHIINHALFKSALFLVVGAVYINLHQLDMYKLGGLWRYMPITALFGLIAAMGIAGIPGLNGYASKTVIHHALEYAVDKQPLVKMIELAFIATGAGTACSFLKFFGFIFMGKTKTDSSHCKDPLLTLSGISLLAILIIALGAFPHLFFSHAAVPALAQTTGAVMKYEIQVFTGHDLQGIATCLILGTLLFIFGVRWHLFHAHPPRWLSIGWLVQTLVSQCSALWNRALRLVDHFCLCAYSGACYLCRESSLTLRQLDNLEEAPGSRHDFRLDNISFDAAVVMLVLALMLVFILRM